MSSLPVSRSGLFRGYPQDRRAGGLTGQNVRVEVATESMTLADAARLFFSKPSPRIITAVFVATAAARVALGSWTWWDLLVPAIILAAQPFTEWNIHVFLLHFRPKTIGNRRIDPLVARKHRAHHADPKDVDLVFIPLPALFGLVGGLALVFLVALPIPRGVSALVGAYLMLFIYEWIHFLIHSSYKPAPCALPGGVAGTPQSPFPQRALLVRSDDAPGRPRSRYLPG